MSCVCYVFVRVCLYVLCGHLLGKGWPLGSRLWCLLWVCHFPIGILGQVRYLIVSIPDLCTLTYFKPSSKIFYWPFKGAISFVDLLYFSCLVFGMPMWASVYMCLVVTCWERADLLALVCGVRLWVCHFPIGILGQAWYLIVSIPDLCTLT